MTRVLVLVLVAGSLVLPASAARLPILASQDWWPVLSPDARWVAFTRADGQGRRFELDVVAARGGRVRKLAVANSQLEPSWSPDSRELAYTAGGDVFTVDRDGTSRRLVAIGRAPAWAPDGSALAVVDGSELHIGSVVLATDVIGRPDWSPGGSEIAFARSDGIYAVTRSGVERLVAHTAGEPGSPVWSGEGTKIAYTDEGWIDVVAADGSSPAVAVAGPYRTIAPLSWSAAGDSVLTTADGQVVSVLLGTPPRVQAGGPGGTGADYAPNGVDFAASLPLPRCPGHTGIEFAGRWLSGTCTITGTAGPDVIDGTSSWGDVILAGAGNDRIHANNGHTDRIDCGPGRDTVWADRSDKLTGCEIVHQ